MEFERVFKKRPFVYLINEKYYAFGQKTCALLGSEHITLPRHYDNYIRAFDEMVSGEEAWRIFHKLSFIAGSEENPAISEKDEFEKLGFGMKEIQELCDQIDKLEEFFKDNYLVEHCS